MESDPKGDRAVVLSAIGVCKRYPGVTALQDVSVDVAAGEVHALVGLNGAGKSTLVKILSGIERPDTGSLCLHGRTVDFRSPRDAIAAGIATIHQELSLLPNLTVAENVMMAALSEGLTPRVSWRRLRRETHRTLSGLGSVGGELDVMSRVGDLSVAQRQIIELAKALQQQAQVILLDEPTATLPIRDVATLFGVMRRLKARGVAMVYISHRMDEIYDIADSVSVLRDGKLVGSYPIEQLPSGRIVREMVGSGSDTATRTSDLHHRAKTVGAIVTSSHPELVTSAPAAAAGAPVLEAREVSDGAKLRGVSLTLHQGELLAIAGLVGSGQNELAKCLFGARRIRSGSILIKGRPQHRHSPRAAIRKGIGFLPSDRKGEGLVLAMSVMSNTTLASHGRFSRFGWLDRPRESHETVATAERLRLKMYGASQVAGTLSGGNQQKVVIAKWLVARSSILVFDEPTRGIDVRAKQEIYQLIRRFVAEGGSVLLSSSELSEIAMCDRALVLARGEIVGEMSHEEMAADRDRLIGMFA